MLMLLGKVLIAPATFPELQQYCLLHNIHIDYFSLRIKKYFILIIDIIIKRKFTKVSLLLLQSCSNVQKPMAYSGDLGIIHITHHAYYYQRNYSYTICISLDKTFNPPFYFTQLFFKNIHIKQYQRRNQDSKSREANIIFLREANIIFLGLIF